MNAAADAPSLGDRARGWLRFIWDKATTADDWSSGGEPHGWWDRESTAPMCSFPRFDLGETAYGLPVYADVTPAWREVYTRIADELVGRHTTFWAPIDWLTFIGHDPARVARRALAQRVPAGTPARALRRPGQDGHGRRAVGFAARPHRRGRQSV